MSEALTNRQIEDITDYNPELITVLSWFDTEGRGTLYEEQKIDIKFVNMRDDTLPFPDPTESSASAIQIIEYVWKLSGGKRSDKNVRAAAEAVRGLPEAALVTLDYFEGDTYPETRGKIMGVAHLVAAVVEGATEDQDFWSTHNRGRIYDHIETGMIYLTRAVQIGLADKLEEASATS